MAECEVCGKGIPFAKRAEIDGVVLDVCDDCARLGKEIAPKRSVLIPKKSDSSMRIESIEDEREFAPDFSARIRRAREKMNLTQDEAAMKIGISHQIYKRIESGFKPDAPTARKIERFFGVELYSTEK